MNKRVSGSVVALFTLVVGSFFALAQSADGGRYIPYQGRLDTDGVPVATGTFEFGFTFYGAPTGGTALGSITRTLTVNNGVFSTTIGPVPDAAFNGANGLYVAITVDGVPLSGRQRILAVPFALGTESGADMQVSGDLVVLGSSAMTAVQVTSLSSSGTVSFGTGGQLTTAQGGSLELGSSTTNGVQPTIDFHYGTGAAQDYNVRLQNNADGLLTVTGDLVVTGDFSFGSAANSGCPANMRRLGARCIDATSTQQTWDSGTAACHARGLDICTLDDIMRCDQLNLDNGVAGSCGTRTDDTNIAQVPIATSSAAPVFGESAFSNVYCYRGAQLIGIGNVSNTAGFCSTGANQHVYCCGNGLPLQ
jgi:hypothetical protein